MKYTTDTEFADLMEQRLLSKVVGRFAFVWVGGETPRELPHLYPVIYRIDAVQGRERVFLVAREGQGISKPSKNTLWRHVAVIADDEEEAVKIQDVLKTLWTERRRLEDQTKTALTEHLPVAAKRVRHRG